MKFKPSNDTSDETKILEDIVDFLNKQEKVVKELKEDFDSIVERVKECNSEYLEHLKKDKIFGQFLEHMDDEGKNKVLIDNEMFDDYFSRKLMQQLCDHEWIKDSIEINDERSENICYCIHCELTKN